MSVVFLMLQAGYVPVTVLMVSDRAALHALCVLWNKLKSCPAIKQLGNGEGGRGTMRVLPYQILFLELCIMRCLDRKEVESLNCPFESHNILDPVYTIVILV